MLYTLLRWLARIALGWYYRSVESAGLDRIPADKPVFLAGNHPNALMDALVIGVLVPRRVRILAKATLFENPLAAHLLRALGVIPLHRARDLSASERAAVDPTRNAATRNAATRNAQAFRAVSEALAANSAVVIFPEGTSHDAPQLVPLRSGLARMALEARDAHGVQGMTILPVGLVFEHKETPRTRVLLQVGEPLLLNADAFPTGASVPALTAEIDRRLRAVTLNFDSADEAGRVLALAHALVVLLAPVRRIGVDEPALADLVRLVRRINRAAQQLESPERIRAFEERFSAFRTRLAANRLAMADIAIDPATAPGIRFAAREGALALVLGPIGLWGRLNHWVPLALTRRLAWRDVTSRDQPAMRSVVLGLALVLLFYTLQTALVASLLGGWWALGYALTLVPSASQDLRYGDRTRRARERIRAYFRFRRDPALQHALLAEAEWLRREAGALERAA